MKAHIGPIVNQITCNAMSLLFVFFTSWAITSLHLLELKSSMTKTCVDGGSGCGHRCVQRNTRIRIQSMPTFIQHAICCSLLVEMTKIKKRPIFN